MSPEGLHVEPKRPELDRGDRALLTAAFAGPLAWLVQLGFGVSVLPWLCTADTRAPLHLATAAALAAVALGVAHCWRRGGGHRRRRDRDAGPPEKEACPALPAEVRRRAAWFGVALGLFFSLLILATTVPGLFLEPCP